MTNDLCCIVVLFKPQLSVIKSWQNLVNECNSIFFTFIDNTPEIEICDKNEIANHLPNYYRLKANCGIAKAQNIGIKVAEKLGVNYIIFFDQDSKPSKDIIFKLKESFCNISKHEKIAAIGPLIHNLNSKEVTNYYDKEFVEMREIISSGTITSMDVIKDIGDMEDTLFIDHVDHEWCWRAKSKGYKIMLATRLNLDHKIGLSDVTCFGVVLHLTAPIRYFYTFRNRRKLMFRAYVPAEWKRYTIPRTIAMLILIPLCKGFKGQKWASFSQAIKGIFAK